MKSSYLRHKFLNNLSIHGSVLQACAMTNTPRATLYRYIKKHPDFRDKMDIAVHKGKEAFTSVQRVSNSIMAMYVRVVKNKASAAEIKLMLELSLPGYDGEPNYLERYLKNNEYTRNTIPARTIILGVMGSDEEVGRIEIPAMRPYGRRSNGSYKWRPISENE